VPWERVIEYYPNGKIKSELFYESMSAQPAYQKTFFENGNLKSINDSAGIRIFDEKGNLMFLKDSLGERTYGENGCLLNADTVAQNWRVNYQVDQDGRFSVSKRSLDGDSSYWARYTSDSILVSEEIRSSKGKLSKEYDSTGILYYSKIVGDSESVETDYYPDGKIWMNKVVQTRESEWEPNRVSFLVEFKEYAENGVALREYELPEANTASKPVCHFRNAAGDSIAVPEPRQKFPTVCKTATALGRVMRLSIAVLSLDGN
jgi:MORN repeat variant.